ncbi:MAG: hypothetical protein SCALA701_13160 [Candidatus Scalindua sp.]|nr:MAG: hypothetical protein SCALA701_13160 [Candidatus Scalindua sp.]
MALFLSYVENLEGEYNRSNNQNTGGTISALYTAIVGHFHIIVKKFTDCNVLKSIKIDMKLYIIEMKNVTKIWVNKCFL